MKRNFALIAACLAFSGVAHTQDQSPPLLRQAAHCLVTAGPELHKLLHGSPRELSLGYYLDTKSYPGEQALYVVNYVGSKLSRGLAYVFFVRQKDHSRVLRVENNASFERRKKGIEFLEKPVGGVWTEEHLQDAIDRISQEPMYLFSVKDLREPQPEVRCESYADAR